MKRIIVSTLLVLATASLLFAGGASEDATINVAAQDVNETVILANMAKIIIEENTPYEATVNTNFTGSSVLHQAMVGGEIDVYPTWTGTQLTGVLRYEGPNLSGEETFRRVKEGFEDSFGFTWTEPFGFNNTYVLVVRRETAEEFDLEVSSDLAPYAADWRLAGDDNYDTRPDAYPGWREHYGIEFAEVLPMSYGLIYRAIDQGEVDVAAAYATDSRIEKLDLVLLEDDQEFFPDYSGAYVVSDRVIEEYPDVIEALNVLSGMIPTEEMISLNSRYDDGEEADIIAREWLEANGVID
ncbi:MAG: glycine betaine ABC transporter substrate-binding protein [Spirochaetota bacterium]